MARPESLSSLERKRIGGVLRVLRDCEGLTQAPAAEILGVDPDTLSLIERGKIHFSAQAALGFLNTYSSRHRSSDLINVFIHNEIVPNLRKEAIAQRLISEAAVSGIGLFEHGLGTQIANHSGLDAQSVRRRIRDLKAQLRQERTNQIG